MATNSIMKNVKIKDKKIAKSLLDALENSKGKKSKCISMKHSVSEISEGDIKKYFED